MVPENDWLAVVFRVKVAAVPLVLTTLRGPAREETPLSERPAIIWLLPFRSKAEACAAFHEPAPMWTTAVVGRRFSPPLSVIWARAA